MKLEKYNGHPEKWESVLKKRDVTLLGRTVPSSQINHGKVDVVQVVSPTQKVLEQAKARIKRNTNSITSPIKRVTPQPSITSNRKAKPTRATVQNTTVTPSLPLKPIFFGKKKK